jgi:uncharacterized membrane protein
MKKFVKLANIAWQRLRATWQKGIYPPPEPLARTYTFWIAFGLVALAALAYSIYFSLFLVAKQNAFMTNGEDLGIMDQAIWNLVHGSMLQQTICNSIGDTNCYGLNGINRFAIHYEPILFPISLLYLIWPSPKALMILQVVIVASGAFPAFWLARLRLRSAWAGVPFALLYLLDPTQQFEVNFDFHAVTLTTALLLFALYFMYVRKTFWFFVFVVLCLACKEEIAGVIVLLGLWVLILQGRWRVGLGVIVLAFCWTGIGLLVVHYSSPIGYSLLASRYTYLGAGPLEIALNILTHPATIIKNDVLEPYHMLYLRKLLAPMGYLPLLAPWVLVLALPTLALNMFSSSTNMISGNYQYNAEIIPILIFASIEATVLIVWFARKLMVNFYEEPESQEPDSIAKRPFAWRRALSLPSLIQVGVLAFVLCYMLMRVYTITTLYDVYNVMPYAPGVQWPQVTPHDRLASRFLSKIPADASVSAQTTLVPHLSHRKFIYLFPYAVDHVDYILLDATSYTYPYHHYKDYAMAVTAILEQGNYGVVDMDDGYLLLEHGYPPSNVKSAIYMIDAHGTTS